MKLPTPTPGRLLTIHHLAWEVGVCAAVGCYVWLHSPWAAALFTGVGILTSVALRSITPIPTFAPCGGSYHVGIRHIPGDPLTGRPPIAAYYPTLIPPPAELEPWLPHENDERYIAGLAAYARLPALLFRHFRYVGMKVTRNAAPLPLRNAATSTAIRPMVVFSHGLAGNYQLYSLLAMDMAARGAIVFVMEHQDGSSSFTRDIHSADDGDCLEYQPCTAPIGSPLERTFREEQLEHRRRETDATLRALGSGTLLHALCVSRRDFADLAAAGGVLPVSLVGHSFGAATAIHTAVSFVSQPAEVRKEFGSVSIESIVAFDTWHLPLQHTTLARVKEIAAVRTRLGSSATPSRLPPLLLLESQQWQQMPVSVHFQQELMTAYSAACGETHMLRRSHNHGNKSIISGTASEGCESVLLVAQEETNGTDHMSACDLAVLSPVISRKAPQGKPRQQITTWARRVLSHIAAAHSDKPGGGV